MIVRCSRSNSPAEGGSASVARDYRFSTQPKPTALEAQRACAAAFLAAVTSTGVEIDGVSVNALQSYRAQSPGFDLILPSENIFGTPAGLYISTHSRIRRKR